MEKVKNNAVSNSVAAVLALTNEVERINEVDWSTRQGYFENLQHEVGIPLDRPTPSDLGFT